jgi:hypothetical protein
VSTARAARVIDVFAVAAARLFSVVAAKVAAKDEPYYDIN